MGSCLVPPAATSAAQPGRWAWGESWTNSQPGDSGARTLAGHNCTVRILRGTTAQTRLLCVGDDTARACGIGLSRSCYRGQAFSGARPAFFIFHARGTECVHLTESEFAGEGEMQSWPRSFGLPGPHLLVTSSGPSAPADRPRPGAARTQSGSAPAGGLSRRSPGPQ